MSGTLCNKICSPQMLFTSAYLCPQCLDRSVVIIRQPLTCKQRYRSFRGPPKQMNAKLLNGISCSEPLLASMHCHDLGLASSLQNERGPHLTLERWLLKISSLRQDSVYFWTFVQEIRGRETRRTLLSSKIRWDIAFAICLQAKVALAKQAVLSAASFSRSFGNNDVITRKMILPQ